MSDTEAQGWSLEDEAARNRQVRAEREAAFWRDRTRNRSAARRWARWAMQPLDAVVHAARIRRNIRDRAQKVAEYLSRPGFKGLQVGCGPFCIPGWQNSDHLFPRPFFRGLTEAERRMDFHIDITAPLPYPDAALDAVFAEEVIEHVDWPDAQAFLAEARRALRPGGVLRLTTPDARGLARVFAGAISEVTPAHFEPFWLNPVWREDLWLNGQFYYYGHRHLWTFETLAEALRAAGFARVERVEALETASGRPELAGLERHGVGNPEIRRLSRHVRLVVEAFRDPVSGS